MNNQVFLFGMLLLISAAALATDQQGQAHEVPAVENDANDRNTVASPPQTRMNIGEITIPSHFTSMIANGGVIAAGIVMVVAVAALAMQMVSSSRLCSYFSLCDAPQGYQAYSAAPNSVYNDYPAGYAAPAGTYNAPAYQKRSLEYVGPILKALSNAYDKYARQITPATAKKE